MDENTKRLVNVLIEAGHDPYTYSGRGMNGRECVGVSIEGEILAFAADVLAALLNDGFVKDSDIVGDAFHGARSDSMGRRTVVYFPSYRVTSDDLPRGN
jgi:hypothetical protein